MRTPRPQQGVHRLQVPQLQRPGGQPQLSPQRQVDAPAQGRFQRREASNTQTQSLRLGDHGALDEFPNKAAQNPVVLGSQAGKTQHSGICPRVHPPQRRQCLKAKAVASITEIPVGGCDHFDVNVCEAV